MKLLLMVFLAGYFLGRESEKRGGGKNLLINLLRDWAVYLLCAGMAVVIGVMSGDAAHAFQPAILLMAAVLPAIVFRARAVCFLAGAATSFCVLNVMPDLNLVATRLILSELCVLIVAFLYLGARQRALRFYRPFPEAMAAGRLIILFALSVWLVLVYQKIIQIF